QHFVRNCNFLNCITYNSFIHKAYSLQIGSHAAPPDETLRDAVSKIVNEGRLANGIAAIDFNDRSIDVLLQQRRVDCLNALRRGDLNPGNYNDVLILDSNEHSVAAGQLAHYYLRCVEMPSGDAMEMYIRKVLADAHWARPVLQKLPDGNELSLFYIGVRCHSPLRRAEYDQKSKFKTRYRNLTGMDPAPVVTTYVWAGLGQPCASEEAYRQSAVVQDIERNLIAFAGNHLINSGSGGFYYQWEVPTDLNRFLGHFAAYVGTHKDNLTSVTAQQNNSTTVSTLAHHFRQMRDQFTQLGAANVANDSCLQELINENKTIRQLHGYTLSALVSKDITLEGLGGNGYGYIGPYAESGPRLEFRLRELTVRELVRRIPQPSRVSPPPTLQAAPLATPLATPQTTSQASTPLATTSQAMLQPAPQPMPLGSNPIDVFPTTRTNFWACTSQHQDVQLAAMYLSRYLMIVRPLIVISHSSKVLGSFHQDVLAECWRTPASARNFRNFIGTGIASNQRDPGNMAYNPAMSALYAKLSFLAKLVYLAAVPYFLNGLDHLAVVAATPTTTITSTATTTATYAAATPAVTVCIDRFKQMRSQINEYLNCIGLTEALEPTKREIKQKELILFSARAIAYQERQKDELGVDAVLERNLLKLRAAHEARAQNYTAAAGEPQSQVRTVQVDAILAIIHDRASRGILAWLPVIPRMYDPLDPRVRTFLMSRQLGIRFETAARAIKPLALRLSEAGRRALTQAQQAAARTQKPEWFLAMINLAKPNYKYRPSKYYVCHCKDCGPAEFLHYTNLAHYCAKAPNTGAAVTTPSITVNTMVVQAEALAIQATAVEAGPEAMEIYEEPPAHAATEEAQTTTTIVLSAITSMARLQKKRHCFYPHDIFNMLSKQEQEKVLQWIDNPKGTLDKESTNNRSVLPVLAKYRRREFAKCTPAMPILQEIVDSGDDFGQP
ncbi:hypothetical protein BG015_002471, partial [Linnemannia schmuckeri]